MAITNGITLESCSKLIRDVPDFPKAGIIFKDITPLLASGPHFALIVDKIIEMLDRTGVRAEILACPEARGFIFGAALAYQLGVGFVPIRKPGKLPHETVRVEYGLEYGKDTVEMHRDALGSCREVLLVDDVLATGGTTAACIDLIESTGSRITACVFLLELEFLNGRENIGDYPVHSLLQF